MATIVDVISKKCSLPEKSVVNILRLLDDGCTIPFIARYRKDMTNNASDEQLREFQDVYQYEKKLLDRKDEISRLLEEKGLLGDEIKICINRSTSFQELEDIYRPFKEKKSTRALVAINNNLEPLANLLQTCKLDISELNSKAKTFINHNVQTVQDAINGAKDILAERYSDDIKERDYWRKQILEHYSFEIKTTKNTKPDSIYVKLANKSERISSIPSHRYLALMRGCDEKELSVKINVDLEKVKNSITFHKIPKYSKNSGDIVVEAYFDGFKRLLLPSIEREVHSALKERADKQAIETFGKNLSQLLKSPPVTKKVILGVDPAYKTGCKLAVLDENGIFLDQAVIYPTPPQSNYEASAKKIAELVERYNIKAISIGNGTASRETQEFFGKLNREGLINVGYTVVSEAGASIYSASKIASEEYPELDVTIRGAVSIAARLRDPMAALVKIDPKSLGIGQYQHDVDQKNLEKKLHEVTEDLVNNIGVDPNSASISLLSYVAGVGKKIASAIINHREANGPFVSKSELLKVKGLGSKAYEQCAGFFRIRDGKSVLDNTGVHPESYHIASKLLSYGIDTITDEKINLLSKEFDVGNITLRDIIGELKKPGFDPRESLPPIVFRSDLTDIKELKIGSIVSGVVRNITDFGAFVDIGLKQDGLIHISQMSEKRIAHPLEILSVSEHLQLIRVVDIDFDKGKVSLSLKDL